jgi:acetyl-CoA decarbonylase/synthase complex subunit delta
MDALLPKGVDRLELTNVRIDAEEILFNLRGFVPLIKRALERRIPKRFDFSPKEWPYKIMEVKLGATQKEGGSRDKILTIGGCKSMPFCIFDAPLKNLPIVSFDVFDMPIPLARTVKRHYQDVLDNPSEWARKCVRDFGADMITLHLISTDPKLKDTPIREAEKTLEDVLQAVKVPIIIGGSGNPEKDPLLFERLAEVAENEMCVLASASLNLDYKKVVKSAVKFGHVVLSWTQLDINNQKTLNRYLLKEGLPPERLIMDPTTAALGYGLEYSFSNVERIRIAGLKGDKDLAFPISSGTTNAWGAREAWKKNDAWGPRELRGPLWETITAITMCLAGADLFMMMHPGAVAAFKSVTKELASHIKKEKFVPEKAIETIYSF